MPVFKVLNSVELVLLGSHLALGGLKSGDFPNQLFDLSDMLHHALSGRYVKGGNVFSGNFSRITLLPVCQVWL
ncbi:hypothetical protein N9Z67_00090 [Rhodopirellula sp.]|nr:hypothetical protein [bacterium]MDB4393726.1 hypothetical protein [Rhodopirellula sp.]